MAEPIKSEPWPDYLKRKKAEGANTSADEVPGRPAENGSREEWAAYVSDLGGDPGELKRDQLIDVADELLGGD